MNNQSPASVFGEMFVCVLIRDLSVQGWPKLRNVILVSFVVVSVVVSVLVLAALVVCESWRAALPHAEHETSLNKVPEVRLKVSCNVQRHEDIRSDDLSDRWTCSFKPYSMS